MIGLISLTNKDGHWLKLLIGKFALNAIKTIKSNVS